MNRIKTPLLALLLCLPLAAQAATTREHGSIIVVLATDAPLDALLPVFERDQVAIVLDGREFLGLITRIDLINYLRRAA